MSLRVEQDGRVRRLTLAAPARRNILDAALASLLLNEIRDAQGHVETGAILIDAEGQVFCGGMDFAHPLPDGARFGLCVAELTLVLLDSSGRKDTFALDGRRDADACDWLGRHARARGFDAQALDAALPYEVPAFAGGDVYTAAALGEPLAELAIWFSNANGTLAAIRQWLATQNIDAPPVRCWPHHFDLDTLVTLAPGRTTGIGFEPGDEHYDEPYFYVSLHPAPDLATLPPLPAVAHWHTKHFTAAIAPAHRILAVNDQGAEVAAFLHAAVEAAIAALR